MHLCIHLLILLAFSSPVDIASNPVSVDSANAESPPAESPPAESSTTHLESWINELSILLDDSKYPELLERGHELAARIRLEYPDGSLAEARILDMVVSGACRSTQVMEESALEMAWRAVELKEAVLGPESGEFAASLINLATLFNCRWELETAVPHFERAIEILERIGPEADELRAKTLCSQGVAYRRLGVSGRAMELFREALAIQTRVLGPDHPDVAASLNNIGIMHVRFGDYEQARRVHARALAIREANFGPDNEWVAESLNNSATVLGYLGEYEESIDQQERSVAIFADQLGLEHQRYWWTRMNLAIGYLDIGDHQGALPNLREVAEAISRIFGPDHVQNTYALDALASCYRRSGDPGQGLEIYARSLAIGEATFGEGNYETAATIMEMGRCLIELGRLEEAAVTLHRSLEIREKVLSPSSLELCDLLHRLADVYLQLGEPEEAERFAARSREILEVMGEEAHPLIAEARVLEARALRAMGRSDGALACSLIAEDISRRHLRITMQTLSESRALDYASSRIVGQDLAVSLLRGGEKGNRVQQVWDSVIRSRTAVLDEYSARNLNLRRNPDPVVEALSDTSLVLRERIANLSLRGPGWEDDRTYLQFLAEAREGLDRIERRLSRAGADNGRVRWARDTGFQQVRESLAPDQALVGFLRFEDQAPDGKGDESISRFRAFVLPGPQSEPVIVDLGDADRIERQVAAWRTQVVNGGFAGAGKSGTDGPLASSRGFVRLPRQENLRLDAYRAAADTLRRSVWDPVASLVSGADRVFMVLDGDLHLVNFNALSLGGSGFLIELDQELHVLVNERSLSRKYDDFEPGKGLLALGDPDFEGSVSGLANPVSNSGDRAGFSPCPELDPLVFEPLPGARLEVDLVRRLWEETGGRKGPSRVLTGKKATESVVKSDFAGAGVLHLATHGFVLADPCKEEGIEDTRWRNPLVLSGLALAGANHCFRAAQGDEDGILTAEEVSALDLSGVEWAVLSACDTGLGVAGAHGEGVFGLQRAFTLAGARTVIMSLWSVRDDAALEWMEALYRARWLEERDTACAVREASLAVLAARKAEGRSLHPYYWAGFIAAGDWR